MACTRVFRCDKYVYDIAVAPDGQQFAVGHWCNGGTRLLDARTGEGRTILGVSHVYSAAFSPASQPLLLTLGCGNGNVQGWA